MTSATKPLTENDQLALERESWIDPDTAEAWVLARVTSADGAALVGRSDKEDYSGIMFPVYCPGDCEPKEYFLRRDHPDMEFHDGKLKPRQKYFAPPGRGNRLLYGPGESVEALTDVSTPILLVEGLKKTVAAWRLSRWESETPRFLACGVTGAWNHRGTIGKTTDASGARVSIKGPIPDLDRVNWAERPVWIVYDSDAITNPSVSAARDTLAEELRQRGAHVVVMHLPELDNLDKTGFDDLLAQWGPERVLSWLQAGETGAASSEDPEPIRLDVHDPPPFPSDLLPPSWFRDMVEGVARATETPIELALFLCLAVIATTIQRTYRIEPEPGYTETMNLWIIVALDSGNRKTAVLRAMTAPLLEFERREAIALAPEVARVEAARRLAEDRIKYLRQRAAKASGVDLESARQELFDEEAALPEVPKAVRLWTQDITPEKLGVLMAEHNESMAILSDEGGLFDTLGGRYSQGVPNLDLYLQAHCGAPYRVDRGSRPSIFMESPVLTLGLSPQPAVLKGLAKQPDFRGRGLLARPLIVLPKSTLGHRTLAARPVSEEVRQTYSAQVQELLASVPRDDGQPHRLTLSPDAYQEWKAFQRHVEIELRDGGTFEHIRDWASKLPGSVARLAGVLHCADQVGNQPERSPVSLSTIEAALALGALLERHALAAFSLMAVDSQLDAAQKVWDWVLQQRQDTFSQRDCFHALQGTFREMTAIRPAFEILVERGYLFPFKQKKSVGRPSDCYRVNNRLAKEWR